MTTLRQYQDSFAPENVKTAKLGDGTQLSLAKLKKDLTAFELHVSQRSHLCLVKHDGGIMVTADQPYDNGGTSVVAREVVFVITRDGDFVEGPLWNHPGLAVQKRRKKAS